MLLRLNAGCSHRPRPGFVNVDIELAARPDVVCDLQALPFRSGCFDYIACNHVLEHLNEDAWQGQHQMSKALIEFSRVIKSDGLVEVEVPSPQGEDAVRIQHYTVFGYERLLHIFRRYFGAVNCKGEGTWVRAKGLRKLFLFIVRFDPFWGNCYRFTLRKPLGRTEVMVFPGES